MPKTGKHPQGRLDELVGWPEGTLTGLHKEQWAEVFWFTAVNPATVWRQRNTPAERPPAAWFHGPFWCTPFDRNLRPLFGDEEAA